MSAGYSPRSANADVAFATFVFGLALFATPRAGRRAHAAQMRADFARGYADTRSGTGRIAALGYALGAIADAIGSGLIERATELGRNAAYGLRGARTAPGLSALIVATMAIAIGVNVAMDATVTHVLGAQLPFSDPATLVNIWETNTTNGITSEALTYDDARAVETGVRTARTAFFDSVFGTLSVPGQQPSYADGIAVSTGFFPILQTRPELGRLLNSQDERRAARTMVISDWLWRRAFNADPHIVGRVLTISDEPYTVVGVVPARTLTPDSWRGGVADYDFYLPMTPRDRFAGHLFRMIARPVGNTPLATVGADLGRLFADRARRYPQTNAGLGARAIRVSDALLDGVVQVMAAMAVAVTIVLVIACANVANLFLARGSARSGEIAIRYALGATRRQIIAQLLLESTLYVIAGGVLGLGIAALAMPVLDQITRTQFSFVTPLQVDGATLAITIALVTLAAILAGLAPALSLSRPDLSYDLKRAGRSGSLGAGARLRTVIAAVEIAAAVVIVFVGGLALNTFAARVREPLGYAVDNHYLVSIFGASQRRYDTPGKAVALHDKILGALRSIPGVTGAASSMAIPNWNAPDTTVAVAGRHYAPGSEPEVQFATISPSFFSVMGTSLITGRAFDGDDRIGRPPVAIVNAAFAAAYLGGTAQALGKRIIVNYTTAGQPVVPRTIVGVSANIRPNVHRDFLPIAYLPADQIPTDHGGGYFVIDTRLTPPALPHAVADAIATIDPALPRPELVSFATTVERILHTVRQADSILVLLSLISLVLAMGGIIAILSYNVERRANEIGIRLALGASPRSTIGLVMRSMIVPTVCGVAAGFPLAALGARHLIGTLIDSSAAQPVAEALLVAFVVGCIGVSAYLSARRAARIDPLAALRYD